jgi:hypothetical protein
VSGKGRRLAIGPAAAMALIAAAASPGVAATKKGQAADDPDRPICKSHPVIGSRVKKVRECHTAQEWEELKLQEQLGLGRKQMNGDKGCTYEPGGPGCAIARGGRDTPW